MNYRRNIRGVLMSYENFQFSQKKIYVFVYINGNPFKVVMIMTALCGSLQFWKQKNSHASKSGEYRG